MNIRPIALAGMMSLMGSGAWAACAYENTVPLSSMSAGFEAWKAVTDAMAECGNFEASLDQEFREKQPAAFEADPALYQIGGVANSTIVTLLNDNTIRPLDDLVAEFGQGLSPNQLITIDGQIMAIAMMVNTQHLMYREDILADLGIAPPTNYDEVLAAAAAIRDAGVVDYPLGATMMTGWNLGMEFINMYIGNGGEFFDADNNATIDNEAGIASLETLKAMTEFMDPEYLVSDSTYVQQQFQQGKIAMANLWASRAGAMNDPAESQVVDKVVMGAAPMGSTRPATTVWWDGVVIAKNITDEQAEAAFKLVLEGLDEDMVKANNDAAVWLVPGFVPGPLAIGAIETLNGGAVPFPASAKMGLLHTAIGNGVSDYLIGAKDAATTLADIEAAYTTSAKEAGLIQ